MKNKVNCLIWIINIFLFIGVALAPANAANVVIGVPERAQEHSQWCWAGSSKAVLDYYGNSVSQCTIANWAWSRADCCGNSDFNWSHTCNQPNAMYGASGSLQDILTHWGVNSTARGYALSWATVLSEINAARPFVMRFGWTGGGGHFLDGYGYDDSGTGYVNYMDPWPGNGYTKALYSTTVSASDHNWTHTLQVTTTPVAGEILAASFGSSGLWIYKSGSASWTNITTAVPQQMIYSGSTLYVDFGAIGLWKWNGTAWQGLTSANPENMVAVGSELYVDFGSAYGLWKWTGTAWQGITSANPENMVAAGSALYVDFGSTYGLWKWNGTAWAQQLTTANPKNMVVLGSALYVDFVGSVSGLWKWTGTAWQGITSANPENMVAAGSELYVDFGSAYGLYKWTGTAWQGITSANPENMVASGSALYVDFGSAYGLWKWNGTAWAQQLTTANPENMVASVSALYADFGTSYGLCKWGGSYWSTLTGANPDLMAISN